MQGQRNASARELLAQVTLNRNRVRGARTALADAARDLETSMLDAHRHGASVAEIAEASGQLLEHVRAVLSPRGRAS